ncbi:DUF2267 domain-containing protein [Aquicoccus sp. G2-2]|uniref:DUF2267 domain-containing protein n=1 Tax=Aquicoccus sp. G2-2 TaxID=3092120 RepID=UPI002AE000D1|nr:DUF2267 domain-containing protein [Aquicoccus sp. G2-2]MEA1114965.1 DUF2267 domain-containing protein [Aquicoccus sp. G2-2]
MPMPWTYRHATKEWRAFLDDVKERMSLVSDNSAYTAVDAVFQVFRRRLTAQQGLDFASVLPSVLRAIFVKDWDVSIGPVPFGDRDMLNAEAKNVRVHHNLTPDNAIEATAWAVRRCTNRGISSVCLPGFPRALAHSGMWRSMIPPNWSSASFDLIAPVAHQGE